MFSNLTDLHYLCHCDECCTLNDCTEYLFVVFLECESLGLGLEALSLELLSLDSESAGTLSARFDQCAGVTGFCRAHLFSLWSVD